MTKLAAATEKQKNRRDQRADGAADELEAVEAALKRAGASAMTAEASTTTVEWPSEKNKPTRSAALPPASAARGRCRSPR